MTPEAARSALLGKRLESHDVTVPMILLVRDENAEAGRVYWIERPVDFIAVPHVDRVDVSRLPDVVVKDAAFRSPRTLRLPHIVVHPDDWLTVWIDLVDRQGFLVMDAK